MKLFECANVTESHVVHGQVLQSDSSTMSDKIVNSNCVIHKVEHTKHTKNKPKLTRIV